MAQDNRDKKGFTLTWTIENVLFHIEDLLSTDEFCVKNLENTTWLLYLVKEENGSVSFNLQRANVLKKEPNSLDVHFTISLLNVSVSSDFSFRINSIQSLTLLENAEDLKSQLSPDGSLVVQCFIYKREGENISSELRARTRANVQHFSKVWKITNPIERDSNNKNTISISSRVNADFYFANSLTGHPILLRNGTFDRYIEGKISILDVKMNVISNASGQFLIKSGEKQTFPLCISKDLLKKEKNLYIPNDELCLLCEFTYSTFGYQSEIEKKVEDKTAINKNHTVKLILKNTTTQTLDDDFVSESTEDKRYMNLKENLNHLYREGNFCDVTLRVEDQTFPVHKNILSARSPVFSAMFDNDMLEKSNKEVKISDLDKDTLDRFLQYIYSETFQHLDWDITKKLYFAADKYQVLSLRNRCSFYLKSNLSLQNACEALDLSDLHQDEDLKEACQDFINKNAMEVFRSKEWELLTVNNPLLSAGMIHNFFSLKTFYEY